MAILLVFLLVSEVVVKVGAATHRVRGDHGRRGRPPPTQH